MFTNSVYNYYRKYKNGNNLANRRSLQAIESTFYALTLKEQHLLNQKADQKIQLTFAQAYFKLAVDCYPKYKALSKTVLEKANQNLERKPKLFIGSKSADFIANHISWKLARKIQFLKEKRR